MTNKRRHRRFSVYYCLLEQHSSESFATIKQARDFAMYVKRANPHRLNRLKIEDIGGPA